MSHPVCEFPVLDLGHWIDSGKDVLRMRYRGFTLDYRARSTYSGWSLGLEDHEITNTICVLTSRRG